MLFGSDIVNEKGILNRTLLAQRAFADKEQTQKLNRTTHPWIVKEIRTLIQQYEKQGANVIVLDAPTLIESGLSQDCHKTIGVLAPVQVRLKRIIQRDGLTEEQALFAYSCTTGGFLLSVTMRCHFRRLFGKCGIIRADSRYSKEGRMSTNGKHTCKVFREEAFQT